MVILARLSPVFPFAPIGYALGATSLSTFVFVWATFVGVMPGCILYSWIGASAASAASEGGDIGSYISIAGGVVSTILVSWQAKKSFDEAVAETEEHSK